MTFQEKLYRLRRERSLSQEGLASALGVSRQAVQKWESGAASPDTNNLIALSDFFGVTLDSLLKNDTAALAPALGDGAPEERVWRPYHYEYKSRRTLFGLPLVHIHFGGRRVCRAKGIIAIGNIATGLFAIGGIAAGLISLGGLSAGLLALGGLAIGMFAAGGMGLGLLAAAGGLAVGGYFALGGLAASKCYALGGLAAAGRIAAGGIAFAPVAMGEEARGTVSLLTNALSTQAVRDTILAAQPATPEWIVTLFALAGQ